MLHDRDEEEFRRLIQEVNLGGELQRQRRTAAAWAAALVCCFVLIVAALSWSVWLSFAAFLGAAGCAVQLERRVRPTLPSRSGHRRTRTRTR